MQNPGRTARLAAPDADEWSGEGAVMEEHISAIKEITNGYLRSNSKVCT